MSPRSIKRFREFRCAKVTKRIRGKTNLATNAGAISVTRGQEQCLRSVTVLLGEDNSSGRHSVSSLPAVIDMCILANWLPLNTCTVNPNMLVAQSCA